jgi:hypothetical protein
MTPWNPLWPRLPLDSNEVWLPSPQSPSILPKAFDAMSAPYMPAARANSVPFGAMYPFPEYAPPLLLRDNLDGTGATIWMGRGGRVK